MSKLIEKAEAPYRNNPLFGIQFHLDQEAYMCYLPDERVSFENGHSQMQGGRMYNWQDVYIDGKPTGTYLEESYNGKLFDPMVISFHYPIADCSDGHLITNKDRSNPHFFDCGECFEMRFATLQQLIDYLVSENAIKI